jgi:tRNA nucleotidyltransferase (CCA-adding enzyme)
MQRYGYEGYPVVEDGKVVGLLTRRSVDRALAHHLNVRIASLMDAGSVTIHPEESIESLQRLMADSGWGQIPVVNAKNGSILGIVTRTDLLKTLTASIDRVAGGNLSARLEAALPYSRLALLHCVAGAAYEKHQGVYIVGGFVRDLLLERPSLDFDIVVEGDAISLAKMLVKKFGGRITTHSQFGTAKWYLDTSLNLEKIGRALPEAQYKSNLDPKELPPFLDLITARREFYTHPTALPTVESGSIKLDLHRRDFTINTLALRLDRHHFGELHDYWGGLNDLRSGMVRVLHSLSFVDDPTRVLRAVRFEQRFGFQIEARTLQLIQEARQMIARVSGDRLRHELDHILDEPKIVNMFERLQTLGLLTVIHPDLTWDDWVKTRVLSLQFDAKNKDYYSIIFPCLEARNELDVFKQLFYCLWLIRLPEVNVKVVCERLHYPRLKTNMILFAGSLLKDFPSLLGAKPSEITSRLDSIPLISMLACCLATDEPRIIELIKVYITKWRGLETGYTGDHLRQRGLPPGPVYRRILSLLRAAWLDGLIHSPAEETELFERLLHEAFVSPDKI